MGQSHVPIHAIVVSALLLFTLCSHTSAQPGHAAAPLNDVRSAYRSACLAPANLETVEGFIAAATEWTGENATRPFARGLLATAHMMRAEGLINPLEKLAVFQENRAALEDAIAALPQNPELRLFRLSIQWSVPFFLDYQDNMEEDARLIANALEKGYWSEDPAHAAFAVSFLEHLRDDHSK